MLKRKIYDDLVAWKNKSNGATALMIDGARRVGKSYIAEQFAKEAYSSFGLWETKRLIRSSGIVLKQRNHLDRHFIERS